MNPDSVEEVHLQRKIKNISTTRDITKHYMGHYLEVYGNI